MYLSIYCNINYYIYTQIEYLQHTYESLLLFNGLSIEDLRLCAHDQMDLFPDSPSSQRRTQATDDDLVPEGGVKQGISSNTGAHTGGGPHTASTAVKVRRVDCLVDVGYNLILRPQYMLLVPRDRKDFAGTVSVNSFGRWRSYDDVMYCIYLDILLFTILTNYILLTIYYYTILTTLLFTSLHYYRLSRHVPCPLRGSAATHQVSLCLFFVYYLLLLPMLCTSLPILCLFLPML